MIDKSKYTIYTNKDGRTRCYNKETKKVTSYPRLLMEEKLGRPLEPYEQVHHIDENPKNNSLDNLTIELLREHQKMHNPPKYFDKLATCYFCGKEFLWTAKQQREFTQNKSRGRSQNQPFCSKHCVGLYGRNEQLRRNALLNASKFGETLPMATPSQALKREGVET